MDNATKNSLYGLNVNLGDGMRKYKEVMVGRHFSSLKKTMCCQSREIKHKTRTKMCGKKITT